jgi:putative hydrolase of the HAD superfamily
LNILYDELSKEFNLSIEFIKNIYNGLNSNIKLSNNSSNKFNKSIYIKLLLENLNIHVSNFEKYLILYNDVFFKHFCLFNGVIDVLKLLKSKNIKIAILSNNIFVQQYQKLIKSNIIEYIDVIQTSDECGEEKPNNMIFYSIQSKLNISFNNIAYVGDNYNDDIIPSITLEMLTFLFKKENISDKLVLNDKIIRDKKNNTTDTFIEFNNYNQLLLFFNEYFQITNEYIFLSKYFGQSSLNIQGQGGNISIKMNVDCNNLLFVKSSGFIMGNTSFTEGYSIVNNNKWIDKLVSYSSNREITDTIFGYKNASMETYFHSFMKKYTVHLHFTLSNMFFCSTIPVTLHDFKYNYMIVEYFEPGIILANEIYKMYNNNCDVYFLKNHGVIITATNIKEIIEYYEYIFNYFNLLLNNKYSNELVCFKINEKYNEENYKCIVKNIDIPIEVIKNIRFCFPDMAVFIKNVIETNDINVLNYTKKYDIILFENNVYLISNNLIKIYCLIEIIESFKDIYLQNKGLITMIDNIDSLKNKKEEIHRCNL